MVSFWGRGKRRRDVKGTSKSLKDLDSRPPTSARISSSGSAGRAVSSGDVEIRNSRKIDLGKPLLNLSRVDGGDDVESRIVSVGEDD